MKNPISIDPSKIRIMVIDDEEIILRSCVRILERLGYSVETFRSPKEGLGKIFERLYNVLIVDLMMPEMSGMDILRKVRENCPETEVIMITGYSTVKSAVEAMKLGAADYIPKPFNPDELEVVVKRVLEKQSLLEANRYLLEEVKEKYQLGKLVGQSRGMMQVFRQILKVSSAMGTVLIMGESGTGKEVVARTIHFNSPRKERPFIVVDCSTLSPTILESELFGHVKGSFTGADRSHKGLFELADGGTLFLDEISNISYEIQGKLLRALEAREIRPVGGENLIRVDIRLIAATNRDIQGMVDRGEFREDLYYRLNVVPIVIPPLRERVEDIVLLTSQFLRESSALHVKEVKAISPEALSRLKSHSWPGNIRELRNVIERLVIMAEGITITDHQVARVLAEKREESSIPQDLEELKRAKKAARDKAVSELERSFIERALERNDWNVSKTAVDIGMQRTNLHALMKKYGITSRGKLD